MKRSVHSFLVFLFGGFSHALPPDAGPGLGLGEGPVLVPELELEPALEPGGLGSGPGHHGGTVGLGGGGGAVGSTGGPYSGGMHGWTSMSG
jgi:hypothetical protein